MRTFIALATALAVIYFGTQGSEATDGRRITSGVLLLAILAGLLAWYLTRPKTTG